MAEVGRLGPKVGGHLALRAAFIKINEPGEQAQYTLPTRSNCRVESRRRRRCEHNYSQPVMGSS